MSKTRTLTIAVIVIVIGGALWYLKTAKNGEVPALSEPTTSTASDAIPITRVTGLVAAVGENTLTIKMQGPIDFSNDPVLHARTVVLKSDTNITQIRLRDPEVVKKEMENFQKALATRKERLESPLSRVRESASQIDIRMPVTFETARVDQTALVPGQSLSITTEMDVRLEKSFAAASIEILPPVTVASSDTTSP